MPVALAVSAFGIGTTESVIMGLLPEVAADLHVTIPTAGLLISGYALGVVVGGPLLALAMTALGFGAVFAAFTYIAPMMTQVAGFSDGAVLALGGLVVAVISGLLDRYKQTWPPSTSSGTAVPAAAGVTCSVSSPSA
jgi:DHA1 family inner membrane transport protein